MARRPGPEKAFQTELVAAMHARQWMVEHTYKLRCDDGSWRTGSTLKGKPDLMAWRGKRTLAVEVKSNTGTLRPEQLACLSIMAQGPTYRVWVLRPSDDLDEIRGWLDRPWDAPPVYGFDPLDPLDAFRVVATASQRKAR